jgi:hypothetical protein
MDMVYNIIIKEGGYILKGYKLLTTVYKKELELLHELELQKRLIRDRQRNILTEIRDSSSGKQCIFHNDNGNIVNGELKSSFCNDLELMFSVDSDISTILTIKSKNSDFADIIEETISTIIHRPSMNFIMIKEDINNEKET